MSVRGGSVMSRFEKGRHMLYREALAQDEASARHYVSVTGGLI
jgi:hypothetical protein